MAFYRILSAWPLAFSLPLPRAITRDAKRRPLSMRATLGLFLSPSLPTGVDWKPETHSLVGDLPFYFSQTPSSHKSENQGLFHKKLQVQIKTEHRAACLAHKCEDLLASLFKKDE